MNKWLRLGLPLAVLLLLAGLLARGLQFDPRTLPSAMVGKAVPAFTLPTLAGGTLAPRDLRGQVWILNVFASWCGACIDEHPRLLALAASTRVPLLGMAYKDLPDDTRAWLRQRGDPYRQVALDTDGRIGIDFGVYGVPETYVIDAAGIIRYRQVGPVGVDFFERHVAALLEPGMRK